jgi:hypothetical protein
MAIDAHILKVTSIENGGETSGTGERARKWASDRQALPLAEGDRRLWGMYIRRRGRAERARAVAVVGVRLGGPGGRACKRGPLSSQEEAMICRGRREPHSALHAEKAIL